MQAILAYDWPGNVRELKNTLGYAVIHCAGAAIELEDLPPEVLERAPPVAATIDLPADERERIWRRSHAPAASARRRRCCSASAGRPSTAGWRTTGSHSPNPRGAARRRTRRDT